MANTTTDKSRPGDGHVPLYGLMETGVPNLDRVLGGGLPRRSLTVVIGAPGAGKTMLAEQIAFHAARHDESVLYLTGYSETHDKLLANGRDLSFFDAQAVGRSIQFLSLTDLLREGAADTEDAIITAARARGARLVVVDGFGSIRRFLNGDQEIAHFLYSVGAKLALLGATTLICLEGDPGAAVHYPELTVSDAILALHRTMRGAQERRILEVFKVRGATPLGGQHPYTIDSNGVTIYPRWESTVELREPEWNPERVKFGIPDIDAMTDGGLTAGTMTVVAGSPGIGKTLLGLHFLSQAEQTQEPALYVGFTKDAVQIRERSRIFGLNLPAAEASGRLRLATLPGFDLEADRVAAFIAEDVERRGVRRLMIDSVAELERGVVDPERRTDFLTALMSYLRGQQVTTYVTMHIDSIVSPTLDFGHSPLPGLAENLILLRHAEYQSELHRLITVLKMRFSDYDQTLREYVIVRERGIELLGPAPAATGLLTGMAMYPFGGWPGASPSQDAL